MISSTQVRVTEHALCRYRERIDANADVQTVETRVRSAGTTGKGMRRRVRKSCPLNAEKVSRTGEYSYLLTRAKAGRPQVLFVVKWIGVGRCEVVTCWEFKVDVKESTEQ